MSWDAISGVAESVGAFGVIISLIYVGYQIRQNTLATQRTNARLSASDHARALHAVLDKEVADIVLRGTDDLDSLTPVERYRFDLAIHVWLEANEQAFADYRQQNFPEEFIAIYRTRIAAVLDTPGMRKWWESRRAWHSHEFRNEIDEILANPPEESRNAGIRPLE